MGNSIKGLKKSIEAHQPLSVCLLAVLQLIWRMKPAHVDS